MSGLFEPRKVKFRKQHRGSKGKINGISSLREFSTLQGGDIAICFGSNVRVTSKQYEVIRMLCSKITKSIKRGSYIINKYPNLGITKKAAETRMGGGKGTPDHFVAIMKAGDPLVELSDIGEEELSQIYNQLKCKIKGDLYIARSNRGIK